MNYTTACQCGEVKLILDLPEPIENYQPRKCNCDFCMSRGISYLSDALGMLTISSFSKLKASKQGSE